MRCRVRYFSSKGAYLVLLWTQLLLIVGISFLFLVSYSNKFSPVSLIPKEQLKLIPFLIGFVSAPLSGWLADAKFGNYKVFRFGVVLIFISTVINCLFLILEALVWKENHTFKVIHWCLAVSALLIGGSACAATALPLSLDQMPDASASNITSYIAWSVCTYYVGVLAGDGINLALRTCLDDGIQRHCPLLWALFLVIITSIILCTKFLLSPKWLIIEPKSPQSLKTIYQVLRFAAKHKTPLNRSAFTYWEDKIPSRIDLGKTKFGGPFTTEQVEDVKTILRLLVITIAFFFIAYTFLFHIKVSQVFEHQNIYKYKEISFLLSDFSASGILVTVLYEFLIYPLIRNRIPSSLKRIGAVCLTATIACFFCFILKLAHFLSQSSEQVTAWIEVFEYTLTSGLLAQIFLTSLLEFICAQSPYNMRGLLVSLVTPLGYIAYFLGDISILCISKVCKSNQLCPVIFVSVKTVLSLISFLVFCVVARWYKMRERDENYSTQRVVEEVYDRYLTAAATHKTMVSIKTNHCLIYG